MRAQGRPLRATAAAAQAGKGPGSATRAWRAFCGQLASNRDMGERQRDRPAAPYRAPAVRGSKVCRMHGAGGGAPRGNRNAWKHDAHSAETLALKKEIAALARMARETIAAI